MQGRYLGTPNARLIVHQELAAFFTGASGVTCNRERRCEELPFQMHMALDLEGLARFCLDLDVFRTLIRVGRFDLLRYWRAIGDGELPPDLGPRYTAALERYSPTLRAQVAARFGEHDNSKERAYQDELSQLCSLLGGFLSEISYFATACALQERALLIDHNLFDNMSRRVAESTSCLAHTRHLMGEHDAAIDKHFLALGIYKQLAQTDPQAELDAAQCLVEISSISRHAGNAPRAKSLCMSALRTYRRILGPNHPQVCPPPAQHAGGTCACACACACDIMHMCMHMHM